MIRSQQYKNSSIHLLHLFMNASSLYSYLIIIFISKFPGAKVQYKIHLGLKAMFNKNKMINEITFLLQHKKNASSYRFSKQLKNLQSNQLIVGFISIIYSNQAVKTLPAATIHTLSAHLYIIGSAKPPD